MGPRSSPLGAGEEYVVAARGPQGDCDLPAGASGIVTNVTAVGASSKTNVRLYPAGADTPTTSNLNPSPGAPPTPNAVTTDLDAAGEFAIFNESGTVNLIVDVVGYYEDHNHDDRYEVVPEQFVISPADFNPTFSGIVTERGGTLSTTTGFACFVAPVDLPDGTTISSVTAAVSVANAGDNFTVQLGRHTFADGQNAVTASGGDIASALSGPVSPAGVVTHLTDDTVMSPVDRQLDRALHGDHLHERARAGRSSPTSSTPPDRRAARTDGHSWSVDRRRGEQGSAQFGGGEDDEELGDRDAGHGGGRRGVGVVAHDESDHDR